MNGIWGFEDEYSCFSNFHASDRAIIPFRYLDPKTHKILTIHSKIVENVYQAMKAYHLEDALRILEQPKPVKAKRLGRKVVAIPNWDFRKIPIMLELVRHKRNKDSVYRNKLHSTGHLPIAELNNHGDTFWGIIKRRDAEGYTGANWLGRIHMILRCELYDLCDCCLQKPARFWLNQETDVYVCENCISHDVIYSACTNLPAEEDSSKPEEKLIWKGGVR